jgi:hypothetical protein
MVVEENDFSVKLRLFMRWRQLKPEILGKPGKALLLLALFLSVLALANSAALHKAIHPNAGKADHECAVTLLASGQIHVMASETAPVIAAILLFLCLRETPAAIRRLVQLPPSRGPPAFLW